MCTACPSPDPPQALGVEIGLQPPEQRVKCGHADSPHVQAFAAKSCARLSPSIHSATLRAPAGSVGTGKCHLCPASIYDVRMEYLCEQAQGPGRHGDVLSVIASHRADWGSRTRLENAPLVLT